MFDVSIGTKLKELFDRIFLSRNIFEKMMGLIQTIKDDYDVTNLIARADSLRMTIETITNDIDVVNLYNDCINRINGEKVIYDDKYNIIIDKITLHYTTLVYDDMLQAIEAMRVVTKNLDINYKSSYSFDVGNLLDRYREFDGEMSKLVGRVVNDNEALPIYINSIARYSDNSIRNPENVKTFCTITSTSANLKNISIDGDVEASLGISIEMVQNGFNAQPGYPTVTVNSFETSLKRSFIGKDGVLVLYSNCTVFGNSIILPMFFHLNSDLTYTILQIAYSSITNRSYIGCVCNNYSYLYNYIIFKDGNKICFGINGSAEYEYTTPVTNILNVGTTTQEYTEYVYIISEKSIEFVKHNPITNGEFIVKTINFGLNSIISTIDTIHGFIVLLSNGDIHCITFETRYLDFSINSLKISNTGNTYTTYGNAAIGTVNNYIFILSSYPRILYEITNIIYDENNIGYLRGNYIPTDDFFPWVTLKKMSDTLAKNTIIIGFESKTIDPEIGTDAEASKDRTGNETSRKLSYSPIINDVIVNVDNGGFSVTSVNSKTGESYVRIQDEYEADISIGVSDKDIIGDNGLPNPGVVISVNDIGPIDLMVRRHGEIAKSSPTQYYGMLWNPGLKVVTNDSVHDTTSGPTTFDGLINIGSVPVGRSVELPEMVKNNIFFRLRNYMQRITSKIGEIVVVTTKNDNIYVMNSNLTKVINISDKIKFLKNQVSGDGINSIYVSSGSDETSYNCRFAINNNVGYVILEINPIDLSIIYNSPYVELPLELKGPSSDCGMFLINKDFYMVDVFSGGTLRNLTDNTSIDIGLISYSDLIIIDIEDTVKVIGMYQSLHPTTYMKFHHVKRDGTIVEYTSTEAYCEKYSRFSYNHVTKQLEFTSGTKVYKYDYDSVNDSFAQGTTLELDSDHNIFGIGAGFYSSDRFIFTDSNVSDDIGLYEGKPLNYEIFQILQCNKFTLFNTSDGLKICK